MPELERNILNFGYEINFKHKGMLAHSFDRFYVVAKFILPTVKDLNFSLINFDKVCSYLQEKIGMITILKNIFQILEFIARNGTLCSLL